MKKLRILGFVACSIPLALLFVNLSYKWFWWNYFMLQKAGEIYSNVCY